MDISHFLSMRRKRKKNNNIMLPMLFTNFKKYKKSV